MPDTPRTVSELKTIFADNASGDISAQDMRDLVESLANPVSDGFSKGTTRFANYYTDDFGSISAGTTFFPVWEAVSDAEGWLNLAAYDSTNWFGVEYDAEQTIKLQSGLFMVELQVVMNTDALATLALASIDVVDVRLADATGGYYFNFPPNMGNENSPRNASIVSVQTTRTIVAATDYDDLVIATEAKCIGANITGGNAYLGVYQLAEWSEPSVPA